MDQNSIQEEIKSRLKSGNACYNLVQNLLLFSLLSKYTNIKIHRFIILPVILHGSETCFLTFWDGLRLEVLENRELRKIFGSEGDKVTVEWIRLHNEELNDLFCLMIRTA